MGRGERSYLVIMWPKEMKRDEPFLDIRLMPCTKLGSVSDNFHLFFFFCLLSF